LKWRLTKAFAALGVKLERAFPVDPDRGHGFIYSQRMDMDIFSTIYLDAAVVFATAA